MKSVVLGLGLMLGLACNANAHCPVVNGVAKVGARVVTAPVRVVHGVVVNRPVRTVVANVVRDRPVRTRVGNLLRKRPVRERLFDRPVLNFLFR